MLNKLQREYLEGREKGRKGRREGVRKEWREEEGKRGREGGKRHIRAGKSPCRIR